MFKDRTAAERHEMLDTNCDDIDSVTYMKPFDEDQLRQRKDHLAEILVKITDLENELADYKAEISESLKPLKKESSRLITDIKQKGEVVTEKCYKFLDLEERQVGYYNEDGDLVECRKAYPKELSPSIQMVIRNKEINKASNE